MDCFASIQKTDVSPEPFVAGQIGPVMRDSGPTSTTSSVPLGVSRLPDKTRPLLIVSEHASGSWLASAQDSYHRSTGFAPSNYIFG